MLTPCIIRGESCSQDASRGPFGLSDGHSSEWSRILPTRGSEICQWQNGTIRCRFGTFRHYHLLCDPKHPWVKPGAGGTRFVPGLAVGSMPVIAWAWKAIESRIGKRSKVSLESDQGSGRVSAETCPASRQPFAEHPPAAAPCVRGSNVGHAPASRIRLVMHSFRDSDRGARRA